MPAPSFLMLFIVLFSWQVYPQTSHCDNLVRAGEYQSAITCYQKALKKNKISPVEAFIKIGNCYRNLGDFKSAGDYYHKAIDADRKSVTSWKNFIEALVRMGDTTSLNKYRVIVYAEIGKQEAKKIFHPIDNLFSPGEKLNKDTVIEVSNVYYGKKKVLEGMTPIYNNNAIIFIKEIEEEELYGPYSGGRKLRYLKPFIATLSGDTIVSQINTIDEYISGAYNCGVPSICCSNKTIVVSKNRTGGNPPFPMKLFEITVNNNSSENNRHILLSLKPVSEKIIDFCRSDEYDYQSPSISSDGRTIIFSSNRESNNYDLWIAVRKNDGWEAPRKINNINTEENEISPYLFRDSILFFSSNGHSGYGGYDIFTCIIKGNEAMDFKPLPPLSLIHI